MPLLLAMAWRNLWRHRIRSLLTALAMAIGVAVCMWILALYAGMFGTLREIVIDRQISHLQVHDADFVGRRGMYDTVPDKAVATIQEVGGVREVAPRLYGQALLGTESRTTGAQLVGIVPEQERLTSHLHETVRAGRFLGEAGREVVLGRALAEELEVQVGDEVVAVTQDAMGGIGNDLYAVVGLVETGDTAIDRAGAFLHIEDLQTLLVLDGQIHEIRVLGEDDATDVIGPLETRIEQALAAALPAPEAPDAAEATDTDAGPRVPAEAAGLAVRPWWQVNPMAATMFDAQGVSQFFVLFIVFGLAALGVVNTMLMSVFERTRELGVIRALGMRPAEVVLLIVLEAALLAVLATGMGLVLGLLLDAWIVGWGIDFEIAEGEGFSAGGFSLPPRLYGAITVGSIVQPVVGAFVFAVLAALYPAIRAARLRPVDAIRQD